MPMDRSFVQLNRAATERLRRLVNGLTDDQLRQPVGEHWTVGVCLAHLAFWDRRAMYVMEMTRKEGKAFTPNIDIFVNDLSLPLWAAIPPARPRASHLKPPTLATSSWSPIQKICWS